MNAQELRLGNLISFTEDGTIFSVQQIEIDGLGVKSTEEDTWIEIRQFESIPLTEDWLFKLGFVIHKKQAYYTYKLPNNWHISMWMENEMCAGFEEKGVCYWGEDYLTIRYVHQLQNLYFVMTGNELTLKNQ